MALTKEQFGRRRHRLMRGPSGETYDDAALQPALVIRDERPLLCPPDPASHPDDRHCPAERRERWVAAPCQYEKRRSGVSAPGAAVWLIVSEKRYLKITLSRSSSCSPRRPRATMTPSGSMRRLSGIERTP